MVAWSGKTLQKISRFLRTVGNRHARRQQQPMRTSAALTTVVLGLISCSTPSRPGETTAREAAPLSQAELPVLVRQLLAARVTDHGASSLSVAIVDGQELLLIESVGVASRESRTRATPETTYEVGSIAKPFLAISVLQLVDAGVLELDAPITDYLPQFQIRSRFADSGPPTLRHLLSHRSGLPGELPAIQARPDYQLEMLLPALRKEWLAQPPGRIVRYSSVGFDLAALVVQRVTGEPYESLLAKRVLTPMQIPTAALRSNTTGTLATGYAADGTPAPTVEYGPSGSLRASVREVAQLVRWVNGKGRVGKDVIASEASTTEALSPQNLGAPLDLGALVGLGWFMRKGTVATGDIVYHRGATPGFLAEVAAAPKHGLGVVVLGNDRGNAVPGIADELLTLALRAKTGLDLSSELASVTPVPPPTSGMAQPELLTAIASREFTDGERRLRFRHDRHGLVAATSPKSSVRLVPRGDGTFDIERLVWGISVGEELPGHTLTYERLDGEDVLVARNARGAWIYASAFDPGSASEPWSRRAGLYAPVPQAGGARRARLLVRDGVVVWQVDADNEETQVLLELEDDSLAFAAGFGPQSGRSVSASTRGGVHTLRVRGLEYELIEE